MSSFSRARVQAIALVVAAAVVAAVIGFYALVVEPQQKRTVADRAAAAVASAPTTSATPEATVEQVPTVAFIGDSYTQGAGAGESKPWVTVLAEARGWHAVNLGRGGTGYKASVVRPDAANACNRFECPNYLDMVPEAVKAAPDIVVVSGGRNDGKVMTAEVGTNVKAVFTQLRKALPKAKLVAVSPILGAEDTPESLADLRAAVKASVEEVGGRYVDLGPLFAGKPELIGPDKTHPNPAGHEYLGNAVHKALGAI